MDVRDNRYIGNIRIYMLNSQFSNIAIYDEDHQKIANDTPLELTVQLMQYLRSNLFVADMQKPEHIPEPRLNRLGESAFQRTAAMMAIESAAPLYTLPLSHPRTTESTCLRDQSTSRKTQLATDRQSASTTRRNMICLRKSPYYRYHAIVVTDEKHHF